MYTREGTMSFSSFRIAIARLRVRRAAAFGTPLDGVPARGLPSERFWGY